MGVQPTTSLKFRIDDIYTLPVDPNDPETLRRKRASCEALAARRTRRRRTAGVLILLAATITTVHACDPLPEPLPVGGVHGRR